MAESIDHLVRAESRLATEYSESAKLIGYLKALLSEANGIELALQDTITKRTIDLAEGVVLDVIGKLVGQSRFLIDASTLEYFGFQGATNAASFGDDADPAIGARFASVAEILDNTRELEDVEYRLFIRAKIARNTSKGKFPSVINQISFVFGGAQVAITELGNANIRIGIGRILTANEKVLLGDFDIIPKPGGVGITETYDYEAGEAFAFAGFVGAKGFDDGKFASGF